MIFSLVGAQNVIYEISGSLVALSLLVCSTLPLTFTKDMGVVLVY